MVNVNLILAMIERCREVISRSDMPFSNLPAVIRPQHLVWMCDQLAPDDAAWDESRFNRWIGFIQCALIANRILTIDEVKKMFDEAKNAFGEKSVDLTDHLDPRNPFRLELGGEG